MTWPLGAAARPHPHRLPACAPRDRRAFESTLVALAQRLAGEDPIAGAQDRFIGRVAECLRASHPALPEREVARCVLIARRACVRETLDGD